MTRVLAIAFFSLALGCAEHIGRTELLSQIQAGDAPTIVDVRSQDEYDASHIPGAIHVPFYAMLSGADELPEASRNDEPLVLTCEHGPRAGIARAQLWFVTDRPIRFLEGHMIAWKEDGLPIEAEEASP